MKTGCNLMELDVTGEARAFRTGIAEWRKRYGAEHRLAGDGAHAGVDARADLLRWSGSYFKTPDARPPAARGAC